MYGERFAVFWQAGGHVAIQAFMKELPATLDLYRTRLAAYESLEADCKRVFEEQRRNVHSISAELHGSTATADAIFLGASMASRRRSTARAMQRRGCPMADSIKVTVTDHATGQVLQEKTITNDYVVICADTVWLTAYSSHRSKRTERLFICRFLSMINQRSHY